MKAEWYVAYIKPNSNKKISEILTRKNIENYFPVTKVIKNFSVHRKITDQPLFNSYIFISTTQKNLSELKKLPGVINLVYWLGKPVTINDFEINAMKIFLTQHVNVKIEKINLGNGKGKDFNNLIIEEKNSLMKVKNKNINVILPSIGYKITAEAETSNVRIISSDKVIHKTNLRSPKLFNSDRVFNNF